MNPKLYTIDEAIDFFKKNPSARFDETVEIHLKLGINPKKITQPVRGTVSFPAGSIKKRKIAVFTKKSYKAEELGVDLIGGEDLIKEIQKTGKCDFDIAFAEPEIMKNLMLIAKILGPKGLMPNPKSSTVVTDIKKAIEEEKKGKNTFKSDLGGNLHQGLAKISWPKEKIKKNILAFLEAVNKAKPAAGVKGRFIKKIVLSTTMGPGLEINF